MTSQQRRTLLSSSVLFLAANAFATSSAVGGTDASNDYSDDIVRLSKIEVDSSHLESYKTFLAEEIRASLANEPGVRTLYAVSEKSRPCSFTILEIYDSEAAYRSHLQTPWFKKYKEGTLAMVKSLELVDVDPLVPEASIKQPG